MRVLLLGALGDPHYDRVWDFLAQRTTLSGAQGAWGDPFPAAAADWSGDWIVSYRARWIVPAALLERASLALNFHPGPPEYPGFAPVNWALYDGATTYGVTAHVMTSAVDAGRIVAVRWVPITPDDTVASLLARTYEALLGLCYETLDAALHGMMPEEPVAAWGPHRYTRAEFDALNRLTPEMNPAELQRRRRALTFKHWAPQYVDPDPVGAAR